MTTFILFIVVSYATMRSLDLLMKLQGKQDTYPVALEKTVAAKMGRPIDKVTTVVTFVVYSMHVALDATFTTYVLKYLLSLLG